MPYSRSNSRYMKIYLKLKPPALLVNAILIFSMVHSQHPYAGSQTFLCPVLSSCLASLKMQRWSAFHSTKRARTATRARGH